MIEDREIVIEYRRNGKDCGFLTESGPEFIFKPDRYSAMVVPTEKFKSHLRNLIKEKKARVIRAGTTEAVGVRLSYIIT